MLQYENAVWKGFWQWCLFLLSVLLAGLLSIIPQINRCYPYVAALWVAICNFVPPPADGFIFIVLLSWTASGSTKQWVIHQCIQLKLKILFKSRPGAWKQSSYDDWSSSYTQEQQASFTSAYAEIKYVSHDTEHFRHLDVRCLHSEFLGKLLTDLGTGPLWHHFHAHSHSSALTLRV